MNRGRSRRALSTTVLLLVTALAACTGDDPARGPTAGSTGGGTTASEPEPADPYAVQTLPDGDLEVLKVLRGTLSKRDQDALQQGQVVATPDLFLLLPGDLTMYAVSRETGDLAWKARLRRDDSDSGACPLVSPPDGATTVVVFSGLYCGLVDAYSLEDGSRVSRGQASAGSTPSITGPVRVAGRVYVADDEGISSVEGDGSLKLRVATAQLGLRGYRDVGDLAAVAGSDVLVARSEHEYPMPGGDLFGLRVTEDGGLEQIWDREVAAVHGPAAMLDNTVLRPDLEGVLVDTVRKGVVTPRLLTLDPDTGKRDSTFVLQRDPPGGYPSWIEGKFPEETAADARGQVFSAAGAGGFGYSPNVVRYDVRRNRVAWEWDPDFRPDVAVSGYALGASEDGEHVYVLWAEYGDFRLVELDYATGEQQRVWRVPARAASTMTHATGRLFGDQLVLYSVFGSDYDEALAIVLEVGEPEAD